MRFALIGHENLFGDLALEETADQLATTFFDGDPDPIFSVIEAPFANLSVRFWFWNALTLLVLEEDLDRARVSKFLGAIAERNKEEDPHYWEGCRMSSQRSGS